MYHEKFTFEKVTSHTFLYANKDKKFNAKS